MSDHKKTALLADEQDILAFAQKIQENRNEDQAFGNALNSFLNSRHTTQLIKVSSTPYALQLADAKPLDIMIKPSTIKKCMNPELYTEDGKKRPKSGHELTATILEQLPQQLREPVMVLAGGHENSLIVITDIRDKHDRKVMIAVDLEQTVDRHEIHRVTSMYGRDEMVTFLQKQIQEGKLIACNTEKADEMFQPARLYLPLGETFISFDSSIAYSTANVKREMEQSLQQSLTVDGKTGAISSQDIIIDPKQVQQTAKPEKKKEGFFLGRSKRDSVRRNAAEATKKETPTQEAGTPKHSNDAPGL